MRHPASTTTTVER